MPNFHVLITDYAWPSLEIERGILAAASAELLVAQTGDEAELLTFAPHADAILTCWKRVSPALLDAAPNCRIVSRYGIGLDNIPVDHATALGILVTNVPDFCLDEVSDHTLALILACARRIVTFDRAAHAGKWSLAAELPIPRLRGQTLGLLGFGNTARALAPKAAAFGLRILAYGPRLAPDAAAPWGDTTRDLDLLLRTADYLSIHAPLTPETKGLLNAAALRRMKPSAYLINTARGAIVDEAALLAALTEGWIAGAALDVLAQEPPPPGHPFLALDNVILTPHAAFYSEAAIADLAAKAAGRVAAVLTGTLPESIVNPAVLTQPNLRFHRD